MVGDTGGVSVDRDTAAGVAGGVDSGDVHFLEGWRGDAGGV